MKIAMTPVAQALAHKFPDEIGATAAAREIGIDPSEMKRVLSGFNVSPAAAPIIASFLGVGSLTELKMVKGRKRTHGFRGSTSVARIETAGTKKLRQKLLAEELNVGVPRDLLVELPGPTKKALRRHLVAALALLDE